ncbi:MAG TPA: multiheme c-type cytochrome, partial [Pyrinomonadaceae bacterium]|nr:multiheme c-type cytochrome [Pyrinomonadaceae bacterium]
MTDDKKNLIKAALVVIAAATFFTPLLSRSQGVAHSSGANFQRWRPNGASGGVRYVGPEKCIACHTDKAGAQHNAMAKALETVDESVILKAHPQLKFKNGPYLYQIVRQGSRSIYTVTDGVSTISQPIRWSFGGGHTGQTYVFEHNGSLHESRVSFYIDTQNLDITIGYSSAIPKSLDEAAGRALSPDEARGCIGCHTTGAVDGKQLNLEKLMPGVSCESCHGPGEKHVLAMGASDLKEKYIFNPKKMSGDELTQELCASCHRSAEEILLMPDQAGINNVRFQPYRIFNSPCYSDDKRISCTSCHNPHEPLREGKSAAAYYDAKCNACHLPSVKLQSSAGAKTAAINTLAAVAHSGNNLNGDDAARTAPPCPTGTQNC